MVKYRAVLSIAPVQGLIELEAHMQQGPGLSKAHTTTRRIGFVGLITALLLAFAASASAAPAGQVTSFSAGLLPGSAPDAIAPGGDGNLWFADASAGTVGRITTAGTITNFSPGSGHFPTGIAPGPDGNLWFTDEGSTMSIGRISPTGTITEFTAGLAPGSLPTEIALGPDGNLWFIDEGSTIAIGRITPTGTITRFSAGLNAGSDPLGIAPGPDGNVWFIDEGSTHAIGRITPAGTITEFSTGLNAGSSLNRIAPGPDGNLWFTDTGVTNAIGRITPTGTITNFTTGLNAGSNPLGITPGPDGNLWFADTGSPSAVGRITPAGSITEFSAGFVGPGHQPWAIASGADGNLWLTDIGSTPAIYRIGAGASAPSLDAPSVTGSGEEATQQTCQGDRWATWAGRQPERNAPTFSSPGFQWLLDGAPLAGETSKNYTPVAGDVGHDLSCKVGVTYPLLDVSALATSDAVEVIAENAGPSGPAGGSGSSGTSGADGATGSDGVQGATGPQGAKGRAGRGAKVTCKVKTKYTTKAKQQGRKKVVCRVSFTAASAVKSARLSRRGVVYAEGTPMKRAGRLILRLRHRGRLAPGRYTLRVAQRLNGRKVITKSTVRVR
jgi:streptogramin lyase